jgi:transmembrane sensor
MENYDSMEDLVFSRSFRDWVLNRDSPDAGFWESWVARNPDKQQLVHHAKAVIYALQPGLKKLSDEEIDTEVQKALQRLKDAPRLLPEEAVPGEERSFFSRRLAGATPFSGRYARSLEWAAVFTGVCLVSYFLYRMVTPGHRDVFQSFLTTHKTDPPRRVNGDTLINHTIILPDGSSAWLAQGAKLYYSPRISASGRREVYLEGEAFFTIKKDAVRPFYVYTGHVVTKVLGTSFRVRAWPSEPRTTVIVRTGKVSVYREEDFYAHLTGGNESGGVVLTPNQEIVYDREGEDHRLNKTLTANPERLAEVNTTPADSAMAFAGTPVSHVFKRLQQLYGIPILYDEEAVSSCTLFATLGNESFYEKLNIICKAISASYEVIDGNIVVTAPGCKNLKN